MLRMTLLQETPQSAESPPRYKRRRTALACDSCRRRKTKCNGKQPICDNCIAMGFDCTYLKAKKRSMGSGHHSE